MDKIKALIATINGKKVYHPRWGKDVYASFDEYEMRIVFSTSNHHEIISSLLSFCTGHGYEIWDREKSQTG